MSRSVINSNLHNRQHINTATRSRRTEEGAYLGKQNVKMIKINKTIYHVEETKKKLSPGWTERIFTKRIKSNLLISGIFGFLFIPQFLDIKPCLFRFKTFLLPCDVCLPSCLMNFNLCTHTHSGRMCVGFRFIPFFVAVVRKHIRKAIRC